MKLTFKIKPLVKSEKFENYRTKRFKSINKAMSFLYAEYKEDIINYKYNQDLELYDFWKQFKIVKIR
jgi:hypothetical protein|tara:strand:+ start:111 stop:311 length:201 start_codon:yes stop_codon:yes gene_type:complete